MCLIVVMSLMGVTVAVAVIMLAAAQEPGTCNVYSQAETGNRDRLGKMDCDGCYKKMATRSAILATVSMMLLPCHGMALRCRSQGNYVVMRSTS